MINIYYKNCHLWYSVCTGPNKNLKLLHQCTEDDDDEGVIKIPAMAELGSEFLIKDNLHY